MSWNDSVTKVWVRRFCASRWVICDFMALLLLLGPNKTFQQSILSNIYEGNLWKLKVASVPDCLAHIFRWKENKLPVLWMQMVQCLLMYVTEVGRENREIKWKSQKRKRFDRSSRVSRIFWIVSLLISRFDVTLDGCRSQGSPKPKVVFGVNTKNVIGIVLLIGRKIWLAYAAHTFQTSKTPTCLFLQRFLKGVDKNDFLGGSQTMGKMPWMPFGNK